MNLIVSPAPHIKTRRTTRTIMLDVLIALLPASAAGIVFFGWEAAVFIAISLAGAFLTELVWYLIQHKVWKDSGILKDFFRQFDFTSLVTGLLLALCLPAQIEAWYMPLIGSIFAVGVAKMLFGGTGKNIVNPALAGRIMLFISFTAMTMYPAANFGPIATDAANFFFKLTGSATNSKNSYYMNGISHIMGNSAVFTYRALAYEDPSQVTSRIKAKQNELNGYMLKYGHFHTDTQTVFSWAWETAGKYFTYEELYDHFATPERWERCIPFFKENRPVIYKPDFCKRIGVSGFWNKRKVWKRLA